MSTIAKPQSDEWFGDTAEPPGAGDLGLNGHNGGDGATGFPSPTVHIETGCITGNLKCDF